MGMKMNRVRYKGQELKIDEYDTNKVYGNLKCYMYALLILMKEIWVKE